MCENVFDVSIVVLVVYAPWAGIVVLVVYAPWAGIFARVHRASLGCRPPIAGGSTDAAGPACAPPDAAICALCALGETEASGNPSGGSADNPSGGSAGYGISGRAGSSAWWSLDARRRDIESVVTGVEKLLGIAACGVV